LIAHKGLVYSVKSDPSILLLYVPLRWQELARRSKRSLEISDHKALFTSYSSAHSSYVGSLMGFTFFLVVLRWWELVLEQVGSNNLFNKLVLGCAMLLLYFLVSTPPPCLCGAEGWSYRSGAREDGGARRGIGGAAVLRGTLSVAQDWLANLMANKLLFSMPAMLSGVSSTSRRRPFKGLVVAHLFFSAPSVFVPEIDEEGHGGSTMLSGGAGGPDRVSRNLFHVLLPKSRGCSVMFPFTRVPNVTCNLTVIK
jgi:hypothetical protein